MAIPLLDLKRQYATIRDEVMRVTDEVYEAQAFILGRKVDEFEREFAGYCRAGYAIGVSSGTDALLIALMVLGIEPGDEVIVPAYSFFATAGVVERVGGIPVFADVDEDSLNLDPREIEGHLSSRTKAIIPVHLFGQVADMDAIGRVAERAGLTVIEDAAQAVGADIGDRRAGTLGLMACFSFFPSKNLGAFGDAGAVTTNDEALAEKLVDYRVHGMRPKYFHHAVGGNFRIDALQAAILDVKLRHLDAWTGARQRNAVVYSEMFAETSVSDRVVLPSVLPNRRHVFNQYVVRFSDGREMRDRVMAALREAGIGCEIYYPLTLPAQACFRELPSASEAFPVSEAAAAQSLAIPIFPELERDEMAQVVATVARAMS